MNYNLRFTKALASFIILVLFVGLAALPVQAGVVEGNKGKGGQPIDVQQFVKPGKITIIDFYSKYCPPCEKIGELLKSVAQKNPKVHVVKIDINRPGVEGIDFNSPLSKQYNLSFVPFLKIFDEQGKLKAEGQEAIGMAIEMNK